MTEHSVAGAVRRRKRIAGATAVLAAGGLAFMSGSGLSHERPLPAVVRGELVRAGEYGATVALRAKVDQLPFCTGTVVADYWVLTAEHCFKDSPIGGYYVSTGRNETDRADFEVDRTYPYPLNQRDVMLLKLKTKITSPNVPAMPVSPLSPRSGTVTAIGWGLTTSDPASVPKRLWKVTLPVVACPPETRDSLFCAFDTSRRIAPGDSGGPVTIGDPKSPTLVGVTVTHLGQYSEFEQSEDFYAWVRQMIRP